MKPWKYPEGLGWAGSECFPLEKPENCCLSKYSSLVGSVLPVCDDAFIASSLFKVLPLYPVVQHLINVGKMSCHNLSILQKTLVTELAKDIYTHLLQMSPEDLDSVIKEIKDCCWIWNGKGFSSPGEIVINSMSLYPYFFTITEDFKAFEKIFMLAGATKELNSDLLIKLLHNIKDCHDSNEVWTYEDDLNIVISILGWFSKKDHDERLLIPVQRPDNRLQLEPISSCVYFDGWKAVDDFESDETDEERVHVVHHNVSKNLAKDLRIRDHTNYMINADSFGFEEFGQHEPLTQRLKNILDEYVETVGIFKELLQNADDAQATEVVFVIDWRTNRNSMSSLLDKGMAACQGPALWSYNNAEFTESDFANIQRLGGQTKKDLGPML